MNSDNQLTNFIKHALRSKAKKDKSKALFKSLNCNYQNNTTVFHYNETCSICLESPKDTKVITQCQHLFCHSCLGLWMQTNKSCPVCKQNFE